MKLFVELKQFYKTSSFNMRLYEVVSGYIVIHVPQNLLIIESQESQDDSESSPFWEFPWDIWLEIKHFVLTLRKLKMCLF